VITVITVALVITTWALTVFIIRDMSRQRRQLRLVTEQRNWAIAALNALARGEAPPPAPASVKVEDAA
jgi:hypothetical protein